MQQIERNYLNLKKRKNYFECGDRQKCSNRNLIKSQSENLSTLSQSFGLKIDEFVLSPFKENQKSLPKVTVLPYNSNGKKKIFRSLIAKDLANISNRQYNCQRKTLKGIQRMPSLKLIRNIQNKLNGFFETKKNKFGFYCNPEQKIKFVCEQFLLKNVDFLSQSFKIKLNLDSTTIASNNLLLLIISFNLIDDYENAMNVNGTYILGAFEITKEDYEQVKESTKEVTLILENIKSVEIANNLYDIVFYLGCDYKMNRILLGQKASNSLDG